MHIRSVPMGLVQVRGAALSDHVIPSPITHTPCCFYQVKIERRESGEQGRWKHYRTDMDGVKFYLQDQTGKVLINSYSAEYDLRESLPRIVDTSQLSANVSANLAVTTGTGASDQELLQYIKTAGVQQFADKIEHCLESKGSLDGPKREQGKQTLMGFARAILKAMLSGEGNVPAVLIERIIASRRLTDLEKDQMRQKFLQQIRETSKGPMPPKSVSVSSSRERYRLREFLILPGQEYHVTGTCVENPDARDAHDRNMIVQGHNEKTFLISWKPEQEVQQSLRKRALGMIFGGAALALVFLALLLRHLGLY
jgi:hypothetical protein